MKHASPIITHIMPKTIKKYQLLKGFQLMQFYNINGKVVAVTFSHGIRHPYLIRGMFITDVPELQEAIESDNGFGTIFHEVVPEEIPEEAIQEDIPQKAPEKKKAAKDTPASEPEDVSDIGPDPAEGDPVDYPDVSNLQEARQKMFDLFPGEFKPANLPNKPAVLNKAKAKNITFSKLK